MTRIDLKRPRVDTSSTGSGGSAPTTNETAKNDANNDATSEAAVAKKADVFDRVQAPGAGTASDIPALLAKLGLEQTTSTTATTATTATQPQKIKRRFAHNIRKLVGGLIEREKKLVKHAFEAMKSFGLAAIRCTTKADFVQLHDFAKLAIENGRPLAVLSILTEVSAFLWKYPEEARTIMRFVEPAQKDTWQQKSAWM
mgnify:CR=1 FL=1